MTKPPKPPFVIVVSLSRFHDVSDGVPTVPLIFSGVKLALTLVGASRVTESLTPVESP